MGHRFWVPLHYSSTPRAYLYPPRVRHGAPRLSPWTGRRPSPREMEHLSVGFRRCPVGSCLNPNVGRGSRLMALTSCPMLRSTASSTTCEWGCRTVWPQRGSKPRSYLRIGGMTRGWSAASTRGMSLGRGLWITWRTNTMVPCGRTGQHGDFRDWEPIWTKTCPRPQISEDYRWEVHPMTMKTAYRPRRSRIQTRRRPTPLCGRLYRY